MEKDLFFEKFHQELAKEYGVPTRFIKIIRSQILGNKMGIGDLVDWINRSINKRCYKNNKPFEQAKRRVHFFKLLNLFIEALEFEDWRKILKRTEFDK